MKSGLQFTASSTVPSTLVPPSFLLHLLSANYTAVFALLDPLHV